MKRIINKILLKIMKKFNIPRMETSDKEYEQNLKKYVDTICNPNGEECIVPTEQTKELAKIIFSGKEKGSGVNE